MDLFLAAEDSLRLLRHARRSEGLMLVPAERHAVEAADARVDPERLADMLPRELFSPARDRPVALRFPSESSRSQSTLVRASPNLGRLPEGSYLEVLDACGDPSPFSAGHEGHVYVESSALTVTSAARALYRSVSRELLSGNAALIRLSALAMELLGSYARSPTHPAGGRIVYDLEPLSSTRAVSERLAQMGGTHGTKLARRAVSLANDGSGSPMETLWYFAFCLPPRLGGIHLERPLQNVAIAWPEGARELACHDRLRPDFHWPRYGRVGEYDSELHKSPAAFYEDRNRAKDYALCHLAYFPITDRDSASEAAMLAFLRQLVRSIEEVEDDVFRRRMHRVLDDPEVRAARALLRSLLMPPPLRYAD